MPYNLEEFKQWLKANSKQSLLPLKRNSVEYYYEIKDEQLFSSSKDKVTSIASPLLPVASELAQVFEVWKKAIEPKNLLNTWKELKTKFITTLQNLKANHKDKWTLIKSKSPVKRVKVLPPNQLEKLKVELEKKKALLQKMDKRNNQALLSPQDQIKYDQLKKEITNLSKEIDLQASFSQLRHDEIIDDKIEIQVLKHELDQEIKNKSSLYENLTLANTKIDQLNDKLNWLRTLVRNGDINQLQKLVRGGRI